MKFNRIAPILMTAALLVTGCTIRSNNVSFKKFSHEVNIDEVHQAYDKLAAEKAGIPTDDTKFDFKFKGNAYGTMKSQSIINDKKLLNENIKIEDNYDLAFDASNVMAHSKVKYSLSGKISQGFGQLEYDVSQKGNTEYYAKETKKQENSYTLEIINVKTKRFSSEDRMYESLFGNFLKRSGSMAGLSEVSLISKSAYEELTEKEKANYKFYVDNNVITVTYAGEISDESETSKSVSNTSYTLQYLVSDEQVKISIKTAYKSEREILQDFGNYVKGQKNIDEYTSEYVCTLSLKPVELSYDYSSFGKGFYSISNMFETGGM